MRVRPEPMSRRLELTGARFWRLGVRMSKRNVIDLISSNAVWRQNVGAPIRELIQDSVEAGDRSASSPEFLDLNALARRSGVILVIQNQMENSNGRRARFRDAQSEFDSEKLTQSRLYGTDPAQ